jgi:hypothetical protein
MRLTGKQLPEDEDSDADNEDDRGHPSNRSNIVEINCRITSPSVSLSLDILFSDFVISGTLCVFRRCLIDVFLWHKIPIWRRKVKGRDIATCAV